MGKKKQPMYRVVAVDQRAPRDGRYIEQIGRYEPLHDPSIVEIDNDKAAAWLAKGAQPSDTVEKLLNISGAMNTIKIQSGGIHVVGSSNEEHSNLEAKVVGIEKPEAPAEPVDSEAKSADSSEEE
jgi:small subunit ribosomal protein S16